MKKVVDSSYVHSIRNDFAGVALFIGIIWLVFLLDQFIPFLPFERLGLIPREIRGLDGIVTMPFIHKNFSHLLGNTIPLAVTLILLAGSRANSLYIVVMTVLLGGILLWLFGREARHIGASGLVFAMVAFHICAGFFERRILSIVIAVVVGFLYATTLLRGIVPFQQGVSWDGHLLGAIAGGIIAFAVSRNLSEAKTTHAGHSKS